MTVPNRLNLAIAVYEWKFLLEGGEVHGSGRCDKNGKNRYD